MKRGISALFSWLLQLPRWLLMGAVRAYQLILSPHIPSACRFTPSCSAYALQALQQYGAIKGTILAVHRVFRCHPWGAHGYDPPRWYGEPPPPSHGEEESGVASNTAPR